MTYATLPTTDVTLNSIQQNILTAFEDISEAPFLKGQTLEDIDLAAAANTVSLHSLGYQPKGYLVLKATQKEYPTFVSADNESLTLANASASVNTVTLWVF